MMNSVSKQSYYHHLKEKWLKTHKDLHHALKEKHKDLASERLKKHLISSFMFAAIPLASPMATPSATPLPVPTPAVVQEVHMTQKGFTELLRDKLPHEVEPLSSDQEKDVSSFLSDTFHMHVSPQLQGIRLNRSYGFIGQEQHLKRFPGDTIDTHFTSSEEAANYADKGMAPGLGAWGYFAYSQNEMTDKDILREKYYIAVPTFLSPGWNEHAKDYVSFYKYRKMLVVNPENGKAIVTDIADAGPAEWTGKHLGGSPEVMKYLERVDGAQRGPVLYFFIDDPNDTIPLGPINL